MKKSDFEIEIAIHNHMRMLEQLCEKHSDTDRMLRLICMEITTMQINHHAIKDVWEKYKGRAKYAEDDS